MHGYPAHRLESVLGEVSARLGVEAQFFTTPTSIFAGFGTQDEQRTHLMRVEPGETNLGHLSHLDRIMGQVLDGDISASEGSARIIALLAEPPRWARWQTLIAFVLSSASVACFFGVTVFEAIVAGDAGARGRAVRPRGAAASHDGAGARAVHGRHRLHTRLPRGRAHHQRQRVPDVAGRPHRAAAGAHVHARAHGAEHPPPGVGDGASVRRARHLSRAGFRRRARGEGGIGARRGAAARCTAAADRLAACPDLDGSARRGRSRRSASRCCCAPTARTPAGSCWRG